VSSNVQTGGLQMFFEPLEVKKQLKEHKNTIQSLPHSLTKIERFLCLSMCKQESYKCSLKPALEVKEHYNKTSLYSRSKDATINQS